MASYLDCRYAVLSFLAPSTTVSQEQLSQSTLSAGEPEEPENTSYFTVSKIFSDKKSISDTIVVRSKEEPVGWAEAEAFFWREEACFPGRHTRLNQILLS